MQTLIEQNAKALADYTSAKITAYKEWQREVNLAWTIDSYEETSRARWCAWADHRRATAEAAAEKQFLAVYQN